MVPPPPFPPPYKQIRRVISSPTAVHFVALSADGGAWVWGRNEKGPLGTGDARNVYRAVRVRLESAEAVTEAAVGKAHTLLLCGGEVWAAGAGAEGQLGIGKQVCACVPPSSPPVSRSARAFA